MPLKKFEESDVIYNVIKATPQFTFKIYKGVAYINNSLENTVKHNSFNTNPPTS